MKTRQEPRRRRRGPALPLGNAQAEIKERTFKFASQNAKGHPQGQGVEKFAELVEAKSGGKIKVRLFPGGTLGGDLQTVSALQGGHGAERRPPRRQVKEFGVFDFPSCSTRRRRPTRSSTARSARSCSTSCRRRPRRPRLLGARLPQPHQQPAPDREGRGHRRAQDARDPERRSTSTCSTRSAPTRCRCRSRSSTRRSSRRPSTARRTPHRDPRAKFYEVQKYLTITNHSTTRRSVIFSKKVLGHAVGRREEDPASDAALEAAKYQRQASREQAAWRSRA